MSNAPHPLPVPSRRRDPYKFAPVLWWDRHLACVHCPLCHDHHAHIIGRAPALQGQFHPAPCRAGAVDPTSSNGGESYVLLYPWENHHGAEARSWEFDRRDRTFVAVPGVAPNRRGSGGGEENVGLGTGTEIPAEWNSRFGPLSAMTTGQGYLVRMARGSGRLPERGRQFAFATLLRGGNSAPVSAFGGWDVAGCAVVLDAGVWGLKAGVLSERLGCGDPTGQRCAGHVERQLAAYYLDRHVVGCDFEGALGGFEVQELAVVQPALPREAEIVVSGDGVCEGCERFFLRLNGILEGQFGTTIRLRVF